MTSLVAFLVRLLLGLQARWLGTDPADCQRVYFANHTSTLDAAVLWPALPPSIRERTRSVAAKGYWTASVLRRWFANKVFRALLIERRKVTSENNPLREMLAVLDAGDSLIIFPEGGRFPGPEPQKFKAGLFHLAKDRPQPKRVTDALRTASFAGIISIYPKSSRIWMIQRVAKRFSVRVNPPKLAE